LAPFVHREEMRDFSDMTITDALVADTERWRRRPVMRWVVTQYQRHRTATINAS
jgi:hypothetical protein